MTPFFYKKYRYSYCYVGGISGRLIGYPVSVSNCANFGSITTDKAIAGGIISQINFGTAADGAIATISNCLNAGKVSATHVVGGLSGRIYANSNVNNCINIGTVTASASSASNRTRYGALIGVSETNALTNNYFLAGSSSNAKGDYASDGNALAGCTEKSAAEINSSEFATTLGDKWEIVEGTLTLKVVATAGTVKVEEEPEVTTTVTDASTEEEEPETTTVNTEVVPTPPTDDFSDVSTYIIIAAVALIVLLSLCAFVIIKQDKKN